MKLNNIMIVKTIGKDLVDIVLLSSCAQSTSPGEAIKSEVIKKN